MSCEFPGLQDLVDKQFDGHAVRLLEAGCGSASHLDFGGDVWITGIDISQKQLERHSSLNEKVLGDIQRYDFAPRSFDAIICWDVLEHLPQPKLALRKFALTLKPGGIVILKLPNVLSLKGLITKFFPHYLHVLAYRYFYGDKNAGKEDTAPFKTFLRFSVARKAIQRLCKQYGLKTVFLGSIDVASSTWLRNKKAAFFSYVALKRAFQFLTVGLIGDSDFVLVMEKKSESFEPNLTATSTRGQGKSEREPLPMKTFIHANEVQKVLENFSAWLGDFGEVSHDHQSFFAGPAGRAAKSLYYRHKAVGTAAVAPMIFCEAFLPSARKCFYHPIRLPIADAHYAMGFASLYEATGNEFYIQKATHFLEILQKTRCTGFKEYGWGYPFDWVTQNGVISAGTPLITTTPYVFEAFLQMERLRPHLKWHRILESIARHVCSDYKDFKVSETASTCSYTPYDKVGVVNASAYRAFVLASAAKIFNDDRISEAGGRNLNFVLESQNPDGSWPYATDGKRSFVDHFHTCFVLKALAKIYFLGGNEDCMKAITAGVDFYIQNLFDEEGMPRPFAKAPRLTVYRRELYDCAECINLCLLLRKYFPQLQTTLERVTAGILSNWVKPDGSFRSRQLRFGWDDVPMHRWGQSQMFRSLALYLYEAQAAETQAYENNDSKFYVRDLRAA